MKKIFFLVLLGAVFVACKNETKTETTPEKTQEIAYASFGDKIEAENASDVATMAKEYREMKAGDTLSSKMMATVKEVCQAKGCWMTLEMEDSTEVLVRFKDYGFFVPKNIAGQEVIVNGKAYVAETSVEELRHYAKDAGKSDEEIESITEPERTYAFLADGVLVKE